MLIGGNLTAQLMGSHRGIGGAIQVLKKWLQALLPLPTPPIERPRQLAHRLWGLMLGPKQHDPLNTDTHINGV